jgi:hypothetical protein
LTRIRYLGGRRAFVAVLIALAFGIAGTLALVRDSSGSSTATRQLTIKGTKGIAGAAPVANLKRLSLEKVGEASPLLGQERDALPPRWQQQQEQLEGQRAAGGSAGAVGPRSGSSPGATSAGVPSPAVATTFNALDDNNKFIPPDTEGAPGLDKLMVTVNGTVQIQQKAGGSVLSTTPLDNFFSGITDVGTVFDPHVLFDPYASRWIVAAVADGSSTKSALLLAVSQTSDPLGNWNEYRVYVDETGAAWGDFPTVGFNKSWIVVSLNMFTNTDPSSFAGTKTYVFDKAKAYTGPVAGGGAYQVFERDNATYGDFTLSPAATYDPNVPDIYLAEDYDGSGEYSALPLRLFKISGPVGSATLTQLPDPTGAPLGALGNWSDVSGATVGFGSQLGTTQKIDNGDARLSQCVYRNGSIWCANTVFLPLLPTVPPTRSAVQWYEIDPTTSIPAVVRAGRIADGSGTKFFAYPSIAVNKFNDALLGFSRFSPLAYAGADYAYRSCSDAPNTFREETQYQAGGGTYFKTYSGTKNRWGDYSGTWVDPSDDASMWTIQEYAKLFTGVPTAKAAGTWGTWWGQVAAQAHPAPTVPVPTSSDHIPGVSSTNQVVNVTLPANDCSVSYVYKWSTTPDDSLDPATDAKLSGHALALASPSLATGSSWWLHLEALDGAGTASTVAHLGPFPITAPAPPTSPPPPPPPTCIVPSLTGQTLAAARAALVSANCSLGSSPAAFSKTVAKGRIISQAPRPGAERADHAAVDVVVSKGAAPKKPPARVTLCYRQHTVRAVRAKVKQLRERGAKLGACKTAKRHG